MKKIITTVGTSLFSNYQLDKVKDEYGRDYASIDEQLKRVEKASATDIYKGEYKLYINRIQSKIEAYWFEYKGEPNRLASAEIASILNIVTQKKGEEYSVHLLATDTLQSVLAAELILVWFEKNKNICPQVKEILFQRPSSVFELQSQSNYVVKDLQVEDQNLYEQGFMNLIELLNRICEKENSILNITGGYKSIVPILTLYGQLMELPLKYLFNEQDLKSTGELLTIGNLPINFDWPLGELYLDFLTRDGLNKIVNDDDLLLDLESYALIINDKKKNITLTALGRLFKDYAERLNNEKKGDLGFFVELKLLEFFTNEYPDKNITRSKSYWWDIDGSSYHLTPQHENHFTEIEIDLVLRDTDNKEIWYEVKSCSSMGLNKAKKQIEKKIQFWKNTALNHPVEFHLLLYKLPKISICDYRRKIKEISQLFESETCVFVSEYFDLPVKKRGVPDYKTFSAREPAISQLNFDEND